MSPFLFNVYVDELIESLSIGGFGCYIGESFFGRIIGVSIGGVGGPDPQNLSRGSGGLNFDTVSNVVVIFNNPVSLIVSIRIETA